MQHIEIGSQRWRNCSHNRLIHTCGCNRRPMGGFITRKTLGHIQKQNFLDFCRTKGAIEINGESYPRLQILSVDEILNGVEFNTPLTRGRASSDQIQLGHHECNYGTTTATNYHPNTALPFNESKVACPV